MLKDNILLIMSLHISLHLSEIPSKGHIYYALISATYIHWDVDTTVHVWCKFQVVAS